MTTQPYHAHVHTHTHTRVYPHPHRFVEEKYKLEREREREREREVHADIRTCPCMGQFNDGQPKSGRRGMNDISSHTG